MAPFACGTRDRPFPCLRLPPPLTRCGLSGLMRSCARLMVEAWPVMRVAETVSQNSRPEWDAVSACSPVGKLHPTPIANSGSHFPPSPSTGNCIPFQSQIPGHISDTPPIRKAHPTLNTSGKRMRACRPGRPRHRGDGKCHPQTLATVAPTSVKKKASRTSRLSHLYCFARRTANGGATRPARPSWQPPPYGPDHPWWDDPLRQPSCRAAT